MGSDVTREKARAYAQEHYKEKPSEILKALNELFPGHGITPANVNVIRSRQRARYGGASYVNDASDVIPPQWTIKREHRSCHDLRMLRYWSRHRKFMSGPRHSADVNLSPLTEMELKDLNSWIAKLTVDGLDLVVDYSPEKGTTLVPRRFVRGNSSVPIDTGLVRDPTRTDDWGSLVWEQRDSGLGAVEDGGAAIQPGGRTRRAGVQRRGRVDGGASGGDRQPAAQLSLVPSNE
jgi:hypothetical protein